MKEALFYQAKKEAVECNLCWHRCVIKPGRRGICGVRENHSGILYSLVYGDVSAEHIDPVEKKPLFHFLPGTLTCSIATVGCNFKCLHCQNHTLSQSGVSAGHTVSRYRSPEEIVAAALQGGCRSISYTYSEPTIFFEFAYDCCLAAREKGLKNIFVSNGYMSREAAEMLVPCLDAINIDIKAFSEPFYREICGGSMQHVLDNVRFFSEQGTWVEVTTLIIPGLNDSDQQIRSIAEFLAEVDPDICWHVSAFSPGYLMGDRPRTPAERLHSAREIGLEAGLNHVFTGNIRNQGGEDTSCPACNRTLIKRSGFQISANLLESGACPHCSEPLAGVW
jgi:pyruvate formate lyase activating enzyme